MEEISAEKGLMFVFVDSLLQTLAGSHRLTLTIVPSSIHSLIVVVVTTLVPLLPGWSTKDLVLLRHLRTGFPLHFMSALEGNNSWGNVISSLHESGRAHVDCFR